jgi:acyl-CoA thioesterase
MKSNAIVFWSGTIKKQNHMTSEQAVSLGPLLSSERRKSTGLSLNTPEQWMQGRTVYGGLSGGLALEAARTVRTNLPPLRSAQISFVGPLAGDVDVTAEMVRQGRTTTFVGADVRSEGGLGLRAMFVFSKDQPSDLGLDDLAAPPVPDPEDAAMTSRYHPEDFTQNLEIRHGAAPEIPRRPRFLRWVRLVDNSGVDPTVELLAVGDAVPPGALSGVRNAVRMSTMTWTMTFLEGHPQTRDGWWLVGSYCNYARLGRTNEVVTIWDADRRPVVTGMQSIALYV